MKYLLAILIAVSAHAELIKIRLVTVETPYASESSQRQTAIEGFNRLSELGIRYRIIQESRYADVLNLNRLSYDKVDRLAAWGNFTRIRPHKGEVVHYILPPLIATWTPLPYLAGLAKSLCSVGTRRAYSYSIAVEGKEDKARLTALHEILHLIGAFHDDFTRNVMGSGALSYVTDGSTGSFRRLPITRATRKQVANCLRRQKYLGVL